MVNLGTVRQNGVLVCNLLSEVIQTLRELKESCGTVFTVLTGEGRFFSSGADVKGKRAFQDQRGASMRKGDSRVVTKYYQNMTNLS